MTTTREIRKSIPLSVQLTAALLQLGLDPSACDLDHDPALGLRPINPATGDTIPPANDPRYLVWRSREGHKEKTFGTKATTAGSDIHLIAKGKRLRRDQEDFRRRMLAKEPGKPREKKNSIKGRSSWPKGQKIPSRKFRDQWRGQQ